MLERLDGDLFAFDGIDRHRCSPGRLERGDVRYAVINGSPHNPDMVLPGRLVRGVLMISRIPPVRMRSMTFGDPSWTFAHQVVSTPFWVRNSTVPLVP